MKAVQVLCVLIATASTCIHGAEPEPQPGPPQSWSNFAILVWQNKTNASTDRALYESVNLHGFHIDRKNDGLQAFARESHWPYYVDHAAGRGYLHLDERQGEAISRKNSIIVRPNSLVDPKTMDAMKGLLKANIESAKGSSVVAYAFDDETSTGWFCSPVETDGSPNSVAEYRKFLKQMYVNIAALNAEYGTKFGSFDDISPKSFEAFRQQLTPANIANINLSEWCDWRAYMDTQFANVMGELREYANTLDPTVPAGFVGAQGPNAFGGYDYRKLTKAVQWMEAYDIGGTNEILRSFWTQRSPHVQTYFSSKNPRLDSWFLWYYLCHGNRGVICWPEVDGQPWFSNGKVAPFISACAETYKEVQGPVSKLIIDGKFVHDPIAIYYSQPSIQVTWAMDAATHKGTWPNRLSSMDSQLSTSGNSRVAWLKTLEDAGLQAQFIHQDHLLDGVLEKDGYKVLLLNRALCLSDAEVNAIKSFAAHSGTVIADQLCGIFDEHGKARATGALDDLFGIKHDLAKGILGGNTLTEIDGERGGSFTEKNWAVEGAAFAWDMPVIERGLSVQGGGKAESQTAGGVAVVRNGKSIYLNLSPIGYLLKRSKNGGKQWLSEITKVLKSAGVIPRVTVQENGQPATQMETIFWNNPQRMTLCVLKNMDRKASINGFGSTQKGPGADKIKLALTFDAPVKDLKNERTGKVLGDGANFEDDFTPWEANVYTYAP